MTLAHLNGVSFRSLSQVEGCHHSTVYRKVAPVLKSLPHCADVTRKYCTKFCGLLLVDGKFVSVKGYETKIPALYGVDYTTHDIPYYLLSKGENYQTCIKFFQALRLLNYPLQALICDDNQNIFRACQKVYPKAVVQLCHNHYLENIRRQLQSRTEPKHLPFIRSVSTLFHQKRNPDDLFQRARAITATYISDEIYASIMIEIFKRRDMLFGYTNLKGVPLTTNLIECFNSHLQGRLKTIKGFKSFQHADTWLNAYFIKRRSKKFTDCAGKFRGLNGKTSLQKSKNPEIDLPIFFN